MDNYKKILDKIENRDKNISALASETEKLKDNINNQVSEAQRLKNTANNSHKTVIEINREFEEQTTLHGVDYAFLFLAIAVQCLRIYGINKLTTLEAAGKGKIEKYLHEMQEKELENFTANYTESSYEYHACLAQIISTRGVPYDTTRYENENIGLFKGANHRFSTLGHDPLLGLIFGTANILTNTITCYDENIKILGFKVPITNHVVYDTFWQNPVVGDYGSTTSALMSATERVHDDKKSIVAAVIKQVIHIGTDMFTPCGINLPFVDCVLSKQKVEEITKYLSTGDIIKISSSALLAMFFNFIIGCLHGLLYDGSKGVQRKVYAVKTRKIIMLSNVIATSSNVLKNSFEVYNGNVKALKDVDWGGLVVTLNRLIKDSQFINDVKYEFVVNEFIKKIYGD
ncbi:hypothetical protein SDC9_22250 [bioreactor metagenome]|jgi:hypothetical protein|uniref:Uncharacterized protein n=1 Tax=bioreactor metagenome TaxID=1076179 RepID=A0A644UBM6_9ZZZZ|nr:hypothetical protein [Acidaminococcaceae bacterium]